MISIGIMDCENCKTKLEIKLLRTATQSAYFFQYYIVCPTCKVHVDLDSVSWLNTHLVSILVEHYTKDYK